MVVRVTSVGRYDVSSVQPFDGRGRFETIVFDRENRDGKSIRPNEFHRWHSTVEDTVLHHQQVVEILQKEEEGTMKR